MLIEEEIVFLLKEKGFHLVTAESCTGGKLISTIINVSGASSVVDEAYVTYANKAKERLLGVKEQTIKRFGVVSEEVASEMVIGATKRAMAEVGISTTGIAGPLGATAKTPVGMVCFGFKICDKVITITKEFGNIGRDNVRDEAVLFALNYLKKILKEM